MSPEPSPRLNPPEPLSGVPETPVVELAPAIPWLSVNETNRLLRQQGLAKAMAQAFVLDELLQQVPFSEAEEQPLIKAFLEAQEVRSDGAMAEWLELKRLSFEDLRVLATREARLLQWRQRRYGEAAEHHFLKRKLALDQVIYSLLRVPEQGLAEELHQRLKQGEADFAELSPFSQGTEQHSGGRIGPLPLTAAHEQLASRLRVSRPGQLWEPFQAGDVWVVLRLEQQLPAQLDKAMRSKMMDELFQGWLQERVALLLRGEPLPPLPYLPPLEAEPASPLPA